jgi:hypothetical protein
MLSARGSSAIEAAVCATLSPTVGTPGILVPPEAFGISTARTGGGKYVPDDIRFQIFVQAVPKIGLEVLDGHAIRSRGTAVGRDALPRLPDQLLRYVKRLLVLP